MAAKDSYCPNREIVSQAYGVVLDVGTGVGSHFALLDMSKVKWVFGVDPNIEMIDSARSAARQNRFHRSFTFVAHPIENDEGLKAAGIQERSIDTVLCMFVLCSVADVQVALQSMRKYMKPGGKLIFCEHIRHTRPFPKAVQSKQLWRTLKVVTGWPPSVNLDRRLGVFGNRTSSTRTR